MKISEAKYKVGTEVRFQASRGLRPRKLTGKIVKVEQGRTGGIYFIEREFTSAGRTRRQMYRDVHEEDIVEVITPYTDAPVEEPEAQVPEPHDEPPVEPVIAGEQERGCGYRKVGGLYLVGGYASVPCDRLPFKLDVCPVCGAGIKVSRGFTKVNPAALFGPHEGCTDTHNACLLCDPPSEPGYIMLVGEKYYPTPEDFMVEARKMGVSERIPFIPDDLKIGTTPIYFAHHKACQLEGAEVTKAAMETAEPVPGTFAVYRTEDGKYHAKKMSTPERIAQLKFFREQDGAPTVYIVPAETRREAKKMVKRLLKITHQTGIFTAFIPRGVEKLIWESEATPEELEKLAKRGITPVIIKDGDEKHA